MRSTVVTAPRMAVVVAVVACHGERSAPPTPAPPTVSPARVPAGAGPCDAAERELAPGVTWSTAPLGAPPAAGDHPCIDVVRVDLHRDRARVLTAARDGAARTAAAWRDAFRLVAVINAGMFHDSGAPVGLLVEDGTAVGADNPKFG